MEVLGWLLIPLAGLLLGLAWLGWRSREPRPVDAEEGMEELARFRQAMEKPMPQLRRGPDGTSLSDDDVPPTTGRA